VLTAAITKLVLIFVLVSHFRVEKYIPGYGCVHDHMHVHSIHASNTTFINSPKSKVNEETVHYQSYLLVIIDYWHIQELPTHQDRRESFELT